MDILQKVYHAVQYSKDKNELLEIIRAMIPGARETRNIVGNLEGNPIYDAELHLEVLCKIPDRYYPYEYVDWIIECADNTELMKRLYNADVNKFGAFVAVNIADQDEIERMYMSGTDVVKRAVACNPNTRKEFLEKIILVTTDDQTNKFAEETLKEISST